MSDTSEDARVQETVMALLHLTSFRDGPATRAWKGHSFAVMDALHERGWIADPRSKAKSVILTAAGEQAAKTLHAKYFHATAADVLAAAVYIQAGYGAVWERFTSADAYAAWSSAPCLEFGTAPGEAVVWGTEERVVYRGVLESIEEGRGLAHTFAFQGFGFEESSSVSIDVRQQGPVVLVSVRHDCTGAPQTAGILGTLGWPKALSRLKTLLETGTAMPWPEDTGS